MEPETDCNILDAPTVRYSFILSMTGLPHESSMDHDMESCDYRDVQRALDNIGIKYTETDPGDGTDYDYLSRESPGHPFWGRWEKEACELDASGIVDREKLETLLCDGGFIASDCQTLGTLGSPLVDGGPYVVLDVDCHQEQSIVICCLRVTPHFENDPEQSIKFWEALRSAFINRYRYGA